MLINTCRLFISKPCCKQEPPSTPITLTPIPSPTPITLASILSPTPITPSLTPILQSPTVDTDTNVESNYAVYTFVPQSLSSHTNLPAVSSLSSHTNPTAVSSLLSNTNLPAYPSLSSHTNPPAVSSLSHTDLPPGQPISQGTSYQPVNHTPHCISIKPSKKVYLSSSYIQRNQLSNPDSIIEKYRVYRVVSRIPTLAQKLAQESYFGENVLKRCTVMGYRDKPALPWEELNNLKQKVFGLLPQYWNNPIDFERTWENVLFPLANCARGLERDKQGFFFVLTTQVYIKSCIVKAYQHD